MSTTTTHTITFEFPTPRELQAGALTDLIAQCSCGAYEYVYSRTEGAYWHGLHQSNPNKHPHHLLMDSPMPEGWEVAPEATPAPAVREVPAPRTYTCGRCFGGGSIEAFGAYGGRFYQLGDRAECPSCAGAGRVNRWAA